MRLWNHNGKQRDEEGKDSGGSNSRGTEISGRERGGCRRRPRAPAVVAIVGVWPVGSGYGMGERGGGNMHQVVVTTWVCMAEGYSKGGDCEKEVTVVGCSGCSGR
ncbi:hypothetical protein GW17_00053770 [Ensete ventricosum]|nr:hypothetical protein GW17_00053770 [Ensete ventricosum]